MKFKYLGTAAAEGIPALFCLCKTCQIARMRKGKEYRSRAQALINDELLIDFGPDTYHHVLTYDLPLENISNVLITHDHSDHFYVTELEFRRPGFASKVLDEPFHVYGTLPIFHKTNELIKTYLKEVPQATNILKAHLVTPLVPFKVLDYEIMPLPANHSQYSFPVNYYIKQKGKSLLYAHDTGWFKDETWEFLSTLSKPLDFISIDCTGAFLENWTWGHLSLDTVVKTIERLKELKAVDDHTKVVINHFSHNGNANHEELVNEAKKYNIDVSYDGMEINI